MYFNPTIEKYLYRLTNTVQAHHPAEHQLGYTGLAPARLDHNEDRGEEDGVTNEAAILLINEEVEIKGDAGSSIGTPEEGNKQLKKL